MGQPAQRRQCAFPTRSYVTNLYSALPLGRRPASRRPSFSRFPGAGQVRISSGPAPDGSVGSRPGGRASSSPGAIVRLSHGCSVRSCPRTALRRMPAWWRRCRDGWSDWSSMSLESSWTGSKAPPSRSPRCGSSWPWPTPAAKRRGSGGGGRALGRPDLSGATLSHRAWLAFRGQPQPLPDRPRKGEGRQPLRDPPRRCRELHRHPPCR